MKKTARYYLGRIIKIGNLHDAQLINAIEQPISIKRRTFNYTFTDSAVVGSPEKPSYVFGRLAKYRSQGSVEVIDTDRHEEATADIENLIEASAPFVYIPQFSGIAYPHIWNHLEREQFEKAFAEVIILKYQGIFVDCAIEPVVDLRTFVARLSKLKKISKLQAVVNPPNPLFGPCWESLKDYIEQRNLSEVSVQEQAHSDESLNTNIPEIAEIILSQNNLDRSELLLLLEPYNRGIGDAAVLMAADGYGRAKVEGTEGKKAIIIRTRDNQKSFHFDKDPDPEELYGIAYEAFGKINEERYLEH